MNALVDNFIGSNALSRNPHRLRVNVTHSGFSIASSPTSKFNLAFLAEVAFKLAGLLLIPVGGVILFLQALFAPQMAGEPYYWHGQVGLLAAFVFVGVALHRRANKGFLPRVHVNAIREEVRIGTVNVAGDVQVRATYPFSQVESFFIIRSRSRIARETADEVEDRGKDSKNRRRYKGSAFTYSRANYPRAETARMKSRRVQTKTTGRFIRMSFG